MKKSILVITAVMAAFTLKAGDLNTTMSGGNDSKFSIGVSVGAAIPMGAYGSKNTDTTTAVRMDSTHRQNGYASTGFHFDVTAGYLFSSNIGAMVLIGGNMNSFDASTYQTVNDVKSSGGVTVTYSAKSYYVGQYLVGPFVSLPAGDKLKIDIRVLFGLVTANTPTETETESAGSASQTYTSSGNGGSGFGYHFGAGIKYNFNDKMGLTFNLAYTGASISYTGYTETGSGSLGNSTFTNTTLKSTMSTSLLTATVGIAFNL
jgi:hypothetical protein